MSVNSLVTLHYLWICIIVYNRFYHTNHVRRFKLKRPFHQGIKDKENEYKVGDIFIDLCSHLVIFFVADPVYWVYAAYHCLPLSWYFEVVWSNWNRCGRFLFYKSSYKKVYQAVIEGHTRIVLDHCIQPLVVIANQRSAKMTKKHKWVHPWH